MKEKLEESGGPTKACEEEVLAAALTLYTSSGQACISTSKPMQLLTCMPQPYFLCLACGDTVGTL